MSIENLQYALNELEKTGAQFFDTKAPFEKWLQSLNQTSSPGGTDNSEVVFDGVFRVDGVVKGNIRSAHGTLITTEQGRVEADVDVRVAIIDGYLEGTLRATEHVILNSTARVAGDIYTASLSIKNGAVFEGKSFSLERLIHSEISEEEGQMMMAVGA